MADLKITGLTAATAATGDDLLAIVDDPAGTPVTKKITLNALFAWQSYTPTLRGSVTDPTIGNGTLTGKYLQVGKLVFVNISWTFGSTSAAGSGTYTFDAPVTQAGPSGAYEARLLDNGTRYYALSGFFLTTTRFGFAQLDSSGGALTHNFPITWATGDSLTFIAIYEAV